MSKPRKPAKANAAGGKDQAQQPTSEQVRELLKARILEALKSPTPLRASMLTAASRFIREEMDREEEEARRKVPLFDPASLPYPMKAKGNEPKEAPRPVVPDMSKIDLTNLPFPVRRLD